MNSKHYKSISELPIADWGYQLAEGEPLPKRKAASLFTKNILNQERKDESIPGC